MTEPYKPYEPNLDRINDAEQMRRERDEQLRVEQERIRQQEQDRLRQQEQERQRLLQEQQRGQRVGRHAFGRRGRPGGSGRALGAATNQWRLRGGLGKQGQLLSHSVHVLLK